MNASNAQHFTRKALATAVASALVPASACAAVGQVDFAYGDVVGVSSAGEQRRLARGAEINEGDTILTNRGRAQLRFTDGARTSLLPNSEFRVDRYAYEEEAEEESSGFFSLLKGGLRTITGAIGRLRKEAYQVTTPSATIGIRGTEYLVVLGNSASVWVADGEIEACNQGGCTSFEGGESGFIADSDSKPIKTDQKPDTSGGDADTTEYSAAEETDDDGTPDVIGEVLDEEDEETEATFSDGPFYTLAVSLGDNHEGSAASSGGDLVDATFDGGTELHAYSSTSLSGDIGTASVVEAFTDGVVGWGRWVNGVITTDIAFGPRTLTGSESHHYAIGLPTMEMPTSGTASYSLLGGTSPTYANGSGTGTLNSASLNVDFGSGFMGVNVNFSIGGNDFALDTITSVGNGAPYTFADSGSFTSGAACSSGCFSEIKGFFAGEGASRAGLTYNVFDTSEFLYINGAVGFTRSGPGIELNPG